MAHELGAVLRRDDAHRVRGEAVAQRLDRDLRQACGAEDDSPSLVQAEERLAELVARDGQVLGARRPRNRFEATDRVGSQEDPPAAPFASPIPFGAGDTDSRNSVVKAAKADIASDLPVDAMQDMLEDGTLKAIAGAGEEPALELPPGVEPLALGPDDAAMIDPRLLVRLAGGPEAEHEPTVAEVRRRRRRCRRRWHRRCGTQAPRKIFGLRALDLPDRIRPSGEDV